MSGSTKRVQAQKKHLPRSFPTLGRLHSSPTFPISLPGAGRFCTWPQLATLATAPFPPARNSTRCCGDHPVVALHWLGLFSKCQSITHSFESPLVFRLDHSMSGARGSPFCLWVPSAYTKPDTQYRLDVDFMAHFVGWVNRQRTVFHHGGHSSEGRTGESSDSTSAYLFRMQFLSYQGWGEGGA